MLFTLSFGYSVLPGFAIWYLPLGFHFILFLLLPYRFWLTAALALSFGGGLTMQYQGSIYYVFTTHFMLSMSIFIHTLPIIYLARLKRKKEQLFRLKSIVILVLFGFLTRLGNIGFHFISDTSVYDKVPADERLAVFLQHNIAAYPGILFAITTYLVIEGLRHKRHHVKDISWVLISKIVVTLTGLLLVLFHLSEFSQNILKILLFLPIIWCGYRYTWLGSLYCALWINSLLFMLLYGAEPAQLVSFQPFIISYFLIGLVTAGLQLEHRSARQALAKNQLTLKAKHKSLSQSQQELKALAVQIVNLQELEKKNLSQELHDSVGQNITALNLSISLLKKQQSLTDCDPSIINKIRIMTDQIYTNAYELMYWLRPRTVDDLGLTETLTGLFFTNKLRQHQIEYVTNIEGDVDSLNDGLQIAIFRIVQECVKNVIQHSDSKICELHISISLEAVEMHFYDKGKGLPDEILTRPFKGGLFNAQSYILALGGTMEVSNQNGAHMHVHFPL